MAILSPSRRGFIGGFIGLVAAPAIVRIESLMPVRVIDTDDIFNRLRLQGWKVLYERLPLPYAPLTEGLAPLPATFQFEFEEYLTEDLTLAQQKLLNYQCGGSTLRFQAASSAPQDGEGSQAEGPSSSA